MQQQRLRVAPGALLGVRLRARCDHERRHDVAHGAADDYVLGDEVTVVYEVDCRFNS